MGDSAFRSVLTHPCLASRRVQLPLSSGTVFSMEDATNLETSLQACYGSIPGQGLAVRTGRAAFKYLLRDFGSRLGITSLEFRMTPLLQRIRIGSERLAALINGQGSQPVSFENLYDRIDWRLEIKPGHPGITSCHLLGGLLQESLTWMSAGKSYVMEETSCITRGDELCILHFQAYSAY